MTAMTGGHAAGRGSIAATLGREPEIAARGDEIDPDGQRRKGKKIDHDRLVPCTDACPAKRHE